MLERQHAQLVSCVQELYQRAREAGAWGPLPLGGLNRYPSVHDILAALDLLEPKDDGSRESETFNEAAGATQPDHDSPASDLDGVTEIQDHHDSALGQTRSPSLPCGEDASSFLPGHTKQTTSQTSLTSQTPYSQTIADYTSSQARLFTNLAAAPLDRSLYNTSNVPLQYDALITPPSLSLDPPVIGQEYASYHHYERSTTASSDTLPFCHDWAKNGIMVDDSDFSTDFRRLSQLDAGRAGLVEDIM
jgi:hypothetical protein